MEEKGIQLEMSFEPGQNRLRNRLESGTFCILLEVNSPGRESDFHAARDFAAELEFEASEIDLMPVSLAFTDKFQEVESLNVADFAAEVCRTSPDSHLVYLSGRNTSLETQIDTLNLCKAAGFVNVVPVTGNGIPGETAKETRNRVFTDGIHILHHIKHQQDSPFYPGCVVNPFKYTPNDLFPQYFKLIKKLNLGANFIVTQFGWDMLKLQELRWYLTIRGLHYPSVARLPLLSPERVKDILKGLYPGVHISPDFRKILEREIRHSQNQFKAAQWRRLQLYAAGCRLLGYSGIQIAGIENPEDARIACHRIAESIEEFTVFSDWKEAYYEYLARSEMAPYPNRFYMFNGLFNTPHLDETPKMNDSELPESTKKERRHFKLCRFLFSHSDQQPADEHNWSKKILAGCRGCDYCRLPLMHYICPRTCPKGLANGPCGGSRQDGTCELGKMECIHSRRMRLAASRNEIDQLEETYIKPAHYV